MAESEGDVESVETCMNRHDDTPSEGVLAFVALVVVMAALFIGYSLKPDCEPCALHERDIPEQCRGRDWALPIACEEE